MEKPFREVYGHRKYDTIHQQAACLMEGIVRLHPFPDGNKRTALLMTSLFMRVNNIYMVVPIDVVRFLIEVANDDASTEDCIDALICKISRWLEERSAADAAEFDAKLSQYVTKPLWKLVLLSLTGIGLVYARRMIHKWLAIDTHPEYTKGGHNVIQLILLLASSNKRAARMNDPSRPCR